MALPWWTHILALSLAQGLHTEAGVTQIDMQKHTSYWGTGTGGGQDVAVMGTEGASPMKPRSQGRLPGRKEVYTETQRQIQVSGTEWGKSRMHLEL